MYWNYSSELCIYLYEGGKKRTGTLNFVRQPMLNSSLLGEKRVRPDHNGRTEQPVASDLTDTKQIGVRMSSNCNICVLRMSR